jgi:hypothetical protein
MRFRKALVLVNIIMLLASSGCLFAVWGKEVLIGEGIYDYYKNNLTQDYAANFEYVCTAARKSVDDFGYLVLDYKRDVLDAHIDARRSDDVPVKIKIKFMSGSITQVDIRVGEPAYDGTSFTKGLDSYRVEAHRIRDRIVTNLTEK